MLAFLPFKVRGLGVLLPWHLVSFFCVKGLFRRLGTV